MQPLADDRKRAPWQGQRRCNLRHGGEVGCRPTTAGAMRIEDLDGRTWPAETCTHRSGGDSVGLGHRPQPTSAVLAGFHPGVASQPPGARDARQLRAHEYMSAWIWHCYQAGFPPLVLAHVVICGSLAGWTQHFYKVVVPPSSGIRVQIYIEICEEI